VVKVIWQQAAKPPHMDGSMVFARWRQCAPQPNTCCRGPTRFLNPDGITIGSAVFAQLPQSVPILYNRPPLVP